MGELFVCVYEDESAKLDEYVCRSDYRVIASLSGMGGFRKKYLHG